MVVDLAKSAKYAEENTELKPDRLVPTLRVGMHR
jgi:hypothetical protein